MPSKLFLKTALDTIYKFNNIFYLLINSVSLITKIDMCWEKTQENSKYFLITNIYKIMIIGVHIKEGYNCI